LADFFVATVVGNGITGARVGVGRIGGQEKARKAMMAQQVSGWRSGEGERRWLSMLIDAMEQVSRPEARVTPCDPKVLSLLRLQLARPASPHPYWHAPRASHFSLRN
jgi:hypothetical protein